MAAIDRIFTRRSFLASGTCACCAGVFARTFAAPSTPSTGHLGSQGLPTLLELGIDAMERIGQTVWVAEIAPKLWLHSTTAAISGNHLFPANGLILERSGGSLLIDTGYTPDQGDRLLTWSKRRLSSAITLAVSTHYHGDRTGGIEALRKHGVRTLAHPLTCKAASDHHTPIPDPIDDFGAAPYRLGADCELFFPGAGHTRDNIVAWFPHQQVLFGGCFLKSVTSADLGNLADAVVADWAGSVRRVHARYITRKITIPGHGTIAGDPIAHTLALLESAAPVAAGKSPG